MKFSQIRRITQATALSLAIGLGMTACSEDYTIDYLYVTTSRATTGSPDGEISAYKVDNQSGSLAQIVDSPYDSGGRNPVAVVAAPNSKILFVLNHDSSSIVVFAIGTDGKIYPQHTYTVTSGISLPTAATITPDGAYLAVTYTYQPTFTTANPGPGAVAVFPVTYLSGTATVSSTSSNITSAALGTPVTMGLLAYLPVGLNPASIGIAPNPNNCPTTGGTITVLCPNNGGNYIPYVYVVEQTATAGTVQSLTLSPTTGALTSIASTQAGVLPLNIAEDPTGRFVYITDQTANQLIGYTVQNNGSLAPMVNGPFLTGLFPKGITIDPRGKFLYVTNYNNSNLSGYAIDPASGTPAGVSSNGVAATGTGPNCVAVEPSQGIYLYTSNFVDNSVSGLQLDPHTGALVNIQNTPFNAAGNPTCVVAVAAGTHAYQALQP